MHYIYSTLTAPQIYTRTKPGGGDIPVEDGRVYIAGGSNVPDKYMVTPLGVATPVSDEELAILQENGVFQAHVKNGFITIREREADPEKVASDMETRDQSAPLVDGDFEDKPDDEKPKTNTPAKSTSKRSSRRA